MTERFNLDQHEQVEKELKIYRLPHAVAYFDLRKLIDQKKRNPFKEVIIFGLSLLDQGVVALPRDEGLSIIALIPDLKSLDIVLAAAREREIPPTVGFSTDSYRYPIITTPNLFNIGSLSTFAACRAGRVNKFGIYEFNPNGYIEGEKSEKLSPVDDKDLSMYLPQENNTPEAINDLLEVAKNFWAINDSAIYLSYTRLVKIDVNNSTYLVRQNPDLVIDMSQFFHQICLNQNGSQFTLWGENTGESILFYCHNISEIKEILDKLLALLPQSFRVKIASISPPIYRTFFLDKKGRVSFCWPPTNQDLVSDAERKAKLGRRRFGSNLHSF